MHERTGAPLRCTVQAPHSAWPQPNLVPVMPSVSRRAQRMGVDSSASTAWSLPLMFKVGIVRLLGFERRRSKEQRKRFAALEAAASVFLKEYLFD